MLKVLFILFLSAYVLIVLYNTFIKPFSDGYKDNAHSSSNSRGRLIVTHNPEKGKKNNKGNPDDYVDFEEVKDDK